MGVHEDTDTRAIDNFIVRLRRYIEDNPSEPRHLLTVRGVGYRFVAEPKTSSRARLKPRWRGESKSRDPYLASEPSADRVLRLRERYAVLLAAAEI